MFANDLIHALSLGPIANDQNPMPAQVRPSGQRQK